MKITKTDLEQISAYVDGELSEAEEKILDKKISSSLELQKKLEELKKLKQLTSSIKRIPESQYFETRLMAELEDIKSKNLLLRWTPAISIAALIIALMALLKLNPGFIENIWEEQKTNIAGFYQENLQPLLFAADLTNEDIFNFAFNEELPLDNARSQFLHVGYDVSGKEYFEINNASRSRTANDYNNFIRVLNLNEVQKLKVDSIIGMYAEVLESQVLINENKTVAINPKLWNYRKALVADLLVLAQDFNNKNYQKVVPVGFTNTDRIKIINAVNTLHSVDEDNYIFCTPDSVFTASFEFRDKGFNERHRDVELRVNNVNDKKMVLAHRFNYDSSWKNYNEDKNWAKKFEIEIDSNICRVVLPRIDMSTLHIPDFDSINAIIEEVTKQVQYFSYSIPKVESFSEGLKIEYIDGDSVKIYEYKYDNFDSLFRSNYLNFDSLNFLFKDKFMHWNDSMALNFNFDSDNSFRELYNEEIEEQMEELKKEMQQFKKEMRELKQRIKEEPPIK